MCGITGWVHYEKSLRQELAIMREMTETLLYRGPDSEGYYLGERVAFGHRRLVVVDPEGGAQPMKKQAKGRSAILVYNGELYNTEDIRQELLHVGHTFSSHSDTEVLLTAYLEWGENCLEKLNGIFAFAIWDEQRQSLFLARDRLGVKPLFYWHQQEQFVFGSELKTLLAHPQIHPELDREGLAEIMLISPARTPGHGVFRGIKELRPGYCATVSTSGVVIKPYWQLESYEHTDTFEQTVEKVRSLVINAIERQLVADVPVSMLLSGGLDSSVITAVAAKYYRGQGRGKVHTYSIDYKDNDQYFTSHSYQPDSDAAWIKRVSDHVGTTHHSIIFDTPELVDALQTAVIARDLPGMADIDASLYLFCLEMKKETTVVLSGECADEIFGGYPWFHNQETLFADSFPWTRNNHERFKWLSHEWREELQPESYVRDRFLQTIAEVPPLRGESELEQKRRQMFYLNHTWFMNTLLDRKDRMSMRASLEARVPFCDHRLVEYLWNVPWSMKMYDGREKGLLRKAMEGLIPDDVLYRKKSPYPKTHHPAYAKATRDWLKEVISDHSSPLLSIIDRNYVETLLEQEANAVQIPWFGQLMSTPQLFAYLAQVDYWLRTYKVRIV
ncbi:asparagine synthase (glutamine-hydrolyzing) [Brevibacillus daliensis]|uniref:asparagine synthase (glutamine-hydrolyzing) n=1 Tax=Brevibacillus daliensis TaxID=2892995 RepID=UPI001E40F74F|nr:asparagine synthase (glutamine-hydrolyzing) [Brevibacillus daliensis]